MNTTNGSPKAAADLSQDAKRKILERVLRNLKDKFYKPELLGESWEEAVIAHRVKIESATTPEHFEQAMTELLHMLKTSHLGFFHSAARRASSRAALSAAYLSDVTEKGSRWIFQDVHPGGAAANAGIEPGNILLRVSDKEIVPPEHPVFPMNSTIQITVLGNNGLEKTASVSVAAPKGKKLQFVEPTLVHAERLNDDVGYLKVSMFPGLMGVDVANAMSTAIEELGNIRGLVIDLRGNTGGGAGSLRLMSLLTPDKIPVGFAANRGWASKDLNSLKEHFPRLSRIPSSSRFLWLLSLRYLPSLLTKSPVVLESEGLGPKPYHGNVALLVDRHTASAAEMVTVFAKENGLATIVGEKTAGRLLSATSVKVGHGYRLAFPTGAYHTWSGTALEGSPLEPDVVADFSWQNRRSSSTDEQLNAAISQLNI